MNSSFKGEKKGHRNNHIKKLYQEKLIECLKWVLATPSKERLKHFRKKRSECIKKIERWFGRSICS